MALRGMTAAVLSEIAKESIRIAHLVELYLPPSTQYFTNAGRDLVWNANNYESNGNFLEVGQITETLSPTIQTMSLRMSGIPQANIAEILTIQHVDRRIVVRRAFLDANTNVIPEPVILFDGRLNGWNFQEDGADGTATITWTANNHWGGDWSRSSGRHANAEDQKTHFPTDLFFDRIGTQNSQKLKWGSV